MPPRKSDTSKVVSPPEEGASTKDQKDVPKDLARDTVNIEDLNLPKSIVTRLAKGVLPPNTQIQGNAMLAMTKSATVFVNYLASHANEYAQRENRKTLAPHDVFRALEDVEFPDFRPRLEAELAKFNDIQADKRNNYRNKVAANKAGKTSSPGPGEHEQEGDGLVERDGEPAAKRMRRDLDDTDPLEASRDEDQTEEEEGEDDDDDDDETEGEDEQGVDEEERLEDHELEELDEDEALDNGEDSD